MPVLGAFLVIAAIMGLVVGLSVRGDRRRRASSPPPVPRPVPPGYPTGVHLRWGVRPSAPPPRAWPGAPTAASPAAGLPPELAVAFAAANRHDHRAAIEAFQRVLASADESVVAAPVRFFLAQSLIELGRYHDAEDVVRDGLASSVPADGPYRGDLIGKQGEAAWALGELDRAELLLETAAQLPRQLVGPGWVELHLGLVERDRGRLAEARQLALAARSAIDTDPREHTDTLALIDVVLATVEAEAGELDEATARLANARELAGSNEFLASYGTVVASRIARYRGEVESAVGLAEQARTGLDRLGLPPYVAEADLELGRAHAGAGQPAEARDALWRALWAYDRCGCTERVAAIRAEVAQLPS